MAADQIQFDPNVTAHHTPHQPLHPPDEFMNHTQGHQEEQSQQHIYQCHFDQGNFDEDQFGQGNFHQDHFHQDHFHFNQGQQDQLHFQQSFYQENLQLQEQQQYEQVTITRTFSFNQQESFHAQQQPLDQSVSQFPTVEPLQISAAKSPPPQPTPDTPQTLDAFEIGFYLLKSSILERKLDNPKVTAVKSAPPPIPTAQSYLGVPSVSHSSNSQSSSPPGHSHQGSISSTRKPVHTHSRNSSVSSTTSVGSASSVSSHVSTSKPSDPIQALVQTSGSGSARLYSDFTKYLKPKLVRDFTTTQIFADPLTRKMVAKFIEGLTDQRIRRLDTDKRLEEIITLFVSCANSILQTQGNNYQNISKEICDHTDKFIGYLIFYIKKSSHGLISGKRSALIKDLERYSTSLKRNTRLEPKKTVLKTTPKSSYRQYGHRRSSSSGYSSTSIPSNHPTNQQSTRNPPTSSMLLPPSPSPSVSSAKSSTTGPTNPPALSRTMTGSYTVKKIERDINFRIDATSDPLLQYIIEMFEIPQDCISLITEQLLALATDTAALDDLRKSRQDLLHDRHPVYDLNSFSSKGEKETWVRQELRNLDMDMKTLKEKAPYLKDETQIPDDKLSQSNYIYIPENALGNFRTVALHLLEYEYNVFLSKHASSSDQSLNFEFSSSATTILRFIVMFWRLSPVAVGLILIEQAELLEKDGLYSREVFVDIIFPYIVSLYLEGTQSSTQSWHDVEKKIAYEVIPKVLDDMVNLSIEHISIIDYNDTIVVFSKLCKNIADYIQPFSDFEGYEDVGFSDNCEDTFKEQVYLLVGTKFDEQCSHFSPSSSGNVVNIISLLALTLDVENTVRSLRSKLKDTLAGFDIGKMTIELYIWSFLDFLKRRVLPITETEADPYIMRLDPDVDFSSEHIRQLMDSFSYLVDRYERIQESVEKPSALSAVAIFDALRESLAEILKLKVMDETKKVLRTNISKSLAFEDYSELISDDMKVTKELFNAFSTFDAQLRLIEGHRWNSSMTNAELYLIVIGAISEVLVGYSEELVSSVRQDLQEPASTVPHTEEVGYQDKLLKLFNNLTVQDEITQPYSFESSTSIKMNNIQWAIFQLQQLQRDFEFEIINSELEADSDAFSILNMPKLSTFEVKIGRGKDIPKSDRNGLSDPYLVIKRHGEAVARTKTVYETLNPTWNESFEFRQENEYEKMQLELVLWDENVLMKDVVLGNTTIDLNPQLFYNNSSTDVWVQLSSGGRIQLQVTLTVENTDNIFFQYNKCLKQMSKANDEIFALVISKFSDTIQHYISPATVDRFFGPNNKYNTAFFTKYFSTAGAADESQVSAAAHAEMSIEDQFACLLNPLFDYLNHNLPAFVKNLTDEAFQSLMLECWRVFLDALITLVIPDISGRRSTTYKPLTEERKSLIMVWSKELFDFLHHDGKGIPTEDLRATPKYIFFLKLINMDYTRPTQDIIDSVQCLRVEMDKIKCQYNEVSPSLNQSPVDGPNTQRAFLSPVAAARAVTLVTSADLENKTSKYGVDFDMKEIELTLFLRLLLLRGEKDIVHEILCGI